MDIVEKRKILPLPGFEPRLSSPYPVAIPTGLYPDRIPAEKLQYWNIGGTISEVLRENNAEMFLVYRRSYID
jgi:hypothetical protein